RLNETTQKLFQLRFKNASGKIKNPLEIRLFRRDIARIKTVLAESKLSKEKEE
ncbi:MAG: 50S ribosomal protein L29, partial [Clostridia bacterium]|nr:50S ribosomal protein L29 [Clostridia bacterium]